MGVVRCQVCLLLIVDVSGDGLGRVGDPEIAGNWEEEREREGVIVVDEWRGGDW